MIFVLLVVVLLVLGWLATLIGMPGNWLMTVTLAAFTYWAVPAHGAGLWIYAWTALGLTVVGEVVEFGASAAGLAKGGSKRGAALAIVGAVVGSVVGATLGLPIPIIGSVVGVIVCSALGAMLGAVLGEVWKGRNLGVSFSLGKAAFWGRLIGTGAKLICSSIIFVVGVLLVTSA